MGLFSNRKKRRRVRSNPDLIEMWADRLEDDFTREEYFDLFRFDPVPDQVEKRDHTTPSEALQVYEEVKEQYCGREDEYIQGMRPSARVNVTYTVGMNFGAALAEAVDTYADFHGSDYDFVVDRIITHLETETCDSLDEDFKDAVYVGAYHSDDMRNIHEGYTNIDTGSTRVGIEILDP